MPSTTTLFRAARPAFQQAAFQQSRAGFGRATGFRTKLSQQTGRRFQSTAPNGAATQSWFQRMWNSPVGMKTVHFWAPVMKWAIVLAGVSDFARPAEKLSLTQNGALTATGLIWTRWCFVIKPKNYLLAAVNFFLAIVGITQCTRIALWYNSQKKDPVAALKVEAKEATDKLKDEVRR